MRHLWTRSGPDGFPWLCSYPGLVPVNRRRVRAAKRRKSRLAKGVHDLTDAQWGALREIWGGCAYCGATGTPLHRDCVLPVARGGRYTLANVVPACPTCNSSKWHSEVTGWMRRKGLAEKAFLARHLAIHTSLAASAEMPAEAPSPLLDVSASPSTAPNE